MEEKNPIQVADRLFGVVEFLAERESSGLMEIATALELNKSTAHRILTSLQYMGYVRQTEDGKYVLTMKIVELSGKVMSRFDIIGLVRPYLKGLMELTGETVHFVKRDGNEAIYIDKVESRTNTIQMVSHIGSRIPLYCSGVGKAMAATFSSDEVRRMWKESDIKKLTPNTITDYLDFEDTLARVREEGYAIDDEENQLGVRCVAADLSAPGKPAEYALSISAPASRMDDSRLLKLADYMIKTRNEILEAIRPVL